MEDLSMTGVNEHMYNAFMKNVGLAEQDALEACLGIDSAIREKRDESISLLRTRLADVRDELKSEIKDLRNELQLVHNSLRNDLNGKAVVMDVIVRNVIEANTKLNLLMAQRNQ